MNCPYNPLCPVFVYSNASYTAVKGLAICTGYVRGVVDCLGKGNMTLRTNQLIINFMYLAVSHSVVCQPDPHVHVHVNAHLWEFGV